MECLGNEMFERFCAIIYCTGYASIIYVMLENFQPSPVTTFMATDWLWYRKKH